MTPSRPPPSREPPSSNATGRLTIGGRVQRDVRLQAALALLVGIAIVAVPLFIWGRGRKHPPATAPSASTSASVEEAGPPSVTFGDAGAAVAIDAGGRAITIGEPHYLRCMDPGPEKTPPSKCDHIGAIEELVSKAIVDFGAACVPTLPIAQTVVVTVSANFKHHKVRVTDKREGVGTMPPASRRQFFSCITKGLVAPNWDTIGHLHQHYLFVFSVTFSPLPGAPPSLATTVDGG